MNLMLTGIVGLVLIIWQIQRHDLLARMQVQPQTLTLDRHQRLLVFAPHCDDETLSSAGLILDALRRGIEVRVVILTNGDGYLFATMEEFGRIYPKPSDFIRMGKLRQQESLHALEANDYTGFPSLAYAKGFLAQYAEELGVDATDWLDAFEVGDVFADLGRYEYLKESDEHLGPEP